MENWKVYLIECSDGSLYCGVTNKDIAERVDTHNAGKGSKYTRGRLPVNLVICREKLAKREAYRLEYKIKKLPKHCKVNALKRYQQQPAENDA